MLRAWTMALAIMLVTTGAQAADKLTVLLDWYVNPDHGPLVIAREKGFFAANGLDVELIAPSDPNDPPKLVAAGQADIAVTYQPQLHLQIAAGLPLVRIGTLVSTPLNTLVVLADGPIKSVADLKGKRVGFSVAGFEDVLLGTMLANHGLTTADVELINVNFSLSPALISGQVDAVIGAYRNVEMPQMERIGHPGRGFYPEEEGVPSYDELIYVAHKDMIGQPQLVQFMRAIEAATMWILNHPDDAWTTFKDTDPSLDDEASHRAWQETLRRFAQSPAALDHGRYDGFATFLKEHGLIETVPELGTYAIDVNAAR